MKKLILILIFILYFVSIGECAWLSGYDQRIKLTIDHTKIDADLSWFPVTVFLTSSQGEEVFTEFDADDDFDRIAFTTSDGETQLYADCELFDISENKAIYHVSKTGWTISSSTDTDIYLYYDNTAGHNTTYISKSGGTAAQSVWDSNFKAVYHMNDPEPTYDTEYDGSVEPDSDGWTLGGTDYASSDGDILTIDTSADYSYTCYYYKEPDVDFDSGFYLKARIKADTSMSGSDHLRIDINDGTQNERIVLQIFDGSARLWTSIANTTKIFNNTTDYHIYEVYIKGTTAYFYVDGTLVGNQAVESKTVSDLVQFGDIAETLMCKAYIDYLNYALDIGYNPVERIIDSTSNANHGTKKGTNEPIEATGKVGKGQDFDGSDDYIEVPKAISVFTGDFTVEQIVKFNVNNTTQHTFTKPERGASNSWGFRIYADTNSKINASVVTTSPSIAAYTATDIDTFNTDTNYYITNVFDNGSNVKLFRDGTEKASTNTGSTLRTDANVITSIGSYRTDTDYYTVNGIIDETRISSTARSAAWIAATYDSLWDNLLTYSAEETAPTGTTSNPLFIFQNF